jgi:hypothetical protein
MNLQTKQFSVRQNRPCGGQLTMLCVHCLLGGGRVGFAFSADTIFGPKGRPSKPVQGATATHNSFALPAVPHCRLQAAAFRPQA